MKKENIQPLKGFQDFLPNQETSRERVLETIRTVFKTYGFLPINTPALEYKELLTGKYGQEGDKLLYSFRDQGGRDVAMRYDLTVPLSRIVTQYANDLPLPFKRYQIAPVWRADRPQKGRFREFTQCDIDVVGTASLFADAEVIACINASLQTLGIKDVVIRINNRKLLDGLIKASGIDPKKSLVAIRILDKLDKLSEKEVREELALTGINSKQRQALFELLGQGFEDTKDFVTKFEGIEGAGELAELIEILLDMEIKNYQVDLTLARGLDYYTGSIFEFVLPDARQFGSIAGGGRYDNLIGQLSGKPVSAVGCSIGVDRLVEALQELELVKYDAVSDVLVCNLDDKFTKEYLQIVSQLRRAGLNADFYYESVKLDRQLKYANKKNINFAIIVGEDEIASGVATLKNLATGKQERVKLGELVQKLKRE